MPSFYSESIHNIIEFVNSDFNKIMNINNVNELQNINTYFVKINEVVIIDNNSEFEINFEYNTELDLIIKSIVSYVFEFFIIEKNYDYKLICLFSDEYYTLHEMKNFKLKENISREMYKSFYNNTLNIVNNTNLQSKKEITNLIEFKENMFELKLKTIFEICKYFIDNEMYSLEV